MRSSLLSSLNYSFLIYIFFLSWDIHVLKTELTYLDLEAMAEELGESSYSPATFKRKLLIVRVKCKHHRSHSMPYGWRSLCWTSRALIFGGSAGKAVVYLQVQR
ncbi:hypothetical protein DsansV1_C01g0003461 [Dioscorea sansibarensis]